MKKISLHEDRVKRKEVTTGKAVHAGYTIIIIIIITIIIFMD
jgi:hypothetical protein